MSYEETPQYGNLTQSIILERSNPVTGNDMVTTSLQNSIFEHSSKWLIGLPKWSRIYSFTSTPDSQVWADSTPTNMVLLRRRHRQQRHSHYRRLTSKSLAWGRRSNRPKTTYVYDGLIALQNTTDPLGRMTKQLPMT